MQLTITILLFIIGLIAIIKGGDFLVDASLKISDISGISQVVIGATLVSIATTLPEVLVSIIAAAKGEDAMAVGNAVSSMIFNSGMVLGIGIACTPALFKKNKHLIKILTLLLSITTIFLFAFNGRIDKIESIFLLLIFIVFMGYSALSAKKDVASFRKLEKPKTTPKVIWTTVLFFILGVAAIAIGAELLVTQGEKLALALKLSPEFIAVTLIAVGTSLPELITMITSIKKGASSLSLGNIIGANIINCTLLIGSCGLASSGNLVVTKQSLLISIPFLMFMSLVIGLPILIKNKTYRWQGWFLVGLNASYLAYIILSTFI